MSATSFSPPGVLATAWLVARKDLVIEFRTRSAFLAALVFALLAVVIFRFSWDPTAVAAIDLAPGVLWVIFVFSGLLGLHRSFGVEQADRAMDGLLAAPVSREALFLGKALANLLFVAGVQGIAIPAVALFYDLPVGGGVLAGILTVAAMAAVGLVAVGTLFSAMTVNTRLAELLLPMLALPFFVPVVTPAAMATARLLAGRPVAEMAGLLKMLGAFDMIFVVACTLAFPYTLED
ncbi:heme exporter protein CcmB [Roseisolibacter agri]|uniref:Heme exporter protein B n=1 Tax=Roseisolibacter agri TaxID=2014610 RepID=A0AA37Q608_9BACT|nr:heme exporter protein CcmB [Roseisolibacter agri]GLC24377.1 heme ABC transporter permease [Roseisolibacter agri]